jgi:gliding motility-associated-like protein
MRKCLLFVALLIVSQLNNVYAQGLFTAPDTVCERQPIELNSLVPGSKTHYWGFCSAYLFDIPTGSNLGNTFGFDGPTDVEVAKEGDKYYAFIITKATNKFLKLDFGTSLDNTPVVHDYGNFDNSLPIELNSLYVVKDETKGNWHVFVTGGTNVANSAMGRVDFGKSLENVPNVVNFGNVGNVLQNPRGVFVAKEADKWYGYLLNSSASSNLIRVDFDTNVSLTPRFVNIGDLTTTSNPPTLPGSGWMSGATDMAAVFVNGNWYFNVVSAANNNISRIDIGPSLAAITPGTPPQLTAYGNPFIDGSSTEKALFSPSAISIVRDCDSFHMYITNGGRHELVKIDLLSITGPFSSVKNLGNVGGLLNPTGMSRYIRDHDNVYAFVTNLGDNSLSKIKIQQCSNASIASATNYKPPIYSYNAPGIYNVYYAINEGLPDMQVNCKQIVVLPTPSMLLSNDTTICQGDTLHLVAFSLNALTTTWTPDYNLSSTTKQRINAWPEHNVTYRILLPYANGCIVDTAIKIGVHRIKADAGPDRTLSDGAQTILGGPYTIVGPQYAYNWRPAQYIDDSRALNPTVRPPYDFSYYLEVTDTAGCVDIDTVLVHVPCVDLSLPNAFAPGNTNSNNSTFGIMNGQLIKLNYFNIYDRWGKEVFTTTDPTKRWDGKINGEDAQMGVYVWEADGFCTSGQTVRKKGNVTLIR